MTKPFRVFIHLSHQNAVSYCRSLQPARFCQSYLKDEGIELVTDRNIPDGDITGFDALHIHGMPHPMNLAKFCRWQRAGIKIVWGIDDDYTCLPPWNPIKFKPDQYGAFEYLSKHADFIVTSTQTLADTMPVKPSGAKCVPTYVCPNLLEPEGYQTYPDDRSKRTKLTILWCGSNTHLGDLEELVDPVTDVLAKHRDRVNFVFWGECHPKTRQEHLHRGVTELDGCVLADYYDFLGRLAPEIALCPLAENKFNQSKSCLKIAEFWGVNAAVVASPTLPYAQTIRHGVDGFLARTRGEWVDAICHLIENAGDRQRMADTGHDEMLRRFNWHNPECVQPWLKFWRAVAS